MGQEDDFLLELQEGFLFESKDLLAKVESLSLQIEKNPDDDECFFELARLAHNLKGSGNAVGFEDISKFAHKIEDYILSIKSKKILNNTKNLDLLFYCLDLLKADIESLIQDRSLKLNYESIIKNLDDIISSKVINEIEQSVQAPIKTVSLNKNEDKKIINKNSNESIRIPKDKLDYLLDSLGEQVILQSTLDQCKFDIEKHQDLLQKTISLLSKHTLEIQRQVLSLTMVPFGPLFMKLDRSIRDAAKLCNKKVDVHFIGSETEADKSLVESLSDSLTHMVRNAVDHGLEEAEERVKAGKSETGNIYIEVRRTGGQIWIDIVDDGKGLDPEKIRAKALSKGILNEESAQDLSDKEIYKLIFSNGFSTKEETSELSGRGVGMNVVEETVNSLKGTIHIDSKSGLGTCFRVKLPLSLAIFNGAVVRVQNTRYVVPTSDISEIVSLDIKKQVIIGEGKKGIRVRNEIFEIYDLRTIFNNKDKTQSNFAPALLTKKGSLKAFIVDEVIGMQKIVQKPLGEELKSRSGFAAATILGDGGPGIILSINQIQKAS